MVAGLLRQVGGKSGHHRAGWWITSTDREIRESATESKQPKGCRLSAVGYRPEQCLWPIANRRSPMAPVTVKRCGKSAPAGEATRSARQTPPGARPNREQSRLGSLRLPGRLLEAASNRRPRGMTIGRRVLLANVGTEPGLQALFGIFLRGDRRADRSEGGSEKGGCWRFFLVWPVLLSENAKTPRRAPPGRFTLC